MPGDYHDIVKAGIIEFGKKYVGKEILSVSKKKLFIHHRDKTSIKIVYEPDVTFTIDDRSEYTFQILHSQAKKKREIEADIFRAILSPEVSKLLFIVPNIGDKKSVMAIHTIIEDKLLNYGMRPKALPITMFIVMPEEVKSKEDVVIYLDNIAKREKKFMPQPSQ
jgi:hypothetical protein